MKEIQKLIISLNKGVVSLAEIKNILVKEQLFGIAVHIRGAEKHLRQAIDEAELLLLKDESKQPQPPDFANTMLGEVPHVVNDKSEDSTQAVEGATPVVRQNEQTKESCNHSCSPSDWYKGGKCDINGCHE